MYSACLFVTFLPLGPHSTGRLDTGKKTGTDEQVCIPPSILNVKLLYSIVGMIEKVIQWTTALQWQYNKQKAKPNTNTNI